ncbi:uncharacterized protein LOC119836057 [Zerene cesonia]|uniref:uncharacterized protein LOC119836057 n=1 Tax=Zerene cesonia TaxID=33412 RepID=UPI0018E57F2D|nr:uncharacterized protein LOC119836057 [Zerene cesonia]
MKLKIFTAFLLLGLAGAVPPGRNPRDVTIITKKYFSESFVKYTAQHDIVNLLVPLNGLNFDDLSSAIEESMKTHTTSEDIRKVTVFFAEADIDASGKRTYKGLYALKDGKARRILENGRDASASVDDNKVVFLAASDGVYVFDGEDRSVQKYGSITDSIIGIAKESEGELLYILTEDNSVYKVTDNGNKKEKLEDVNDAQQIKLDNDGNLFFYTPDKKVHVRTSEGVKTIDSLPENPSDIVLVNCPVVLEEGLTILVDRDLYIVYKNGTSIFYGLEFAPDFMPTAFGPDATLFQYYAYDKKIYEFNVIELLSEEESKRKNNVGDSADGLLKFVSEKQKQRNKV